MPSVNDLKMQNDGLRAALERAAGAIQVMYAGHGHKGVTGEAVVALAQAIQQDGESWEEACRRATVRLAKDWPNAMTI